MVTSAALTVDEYVAALPEDRRGAIAAVRAAVLAHLPEGYEEVVGSGMLSYVVPLSRYPKTYNKQPLMYAALASQKSHMAVYLTGVYGDPAAEAQFRADYLATGKRLDMGKSCVRFKRLEDLPLEVIGKAVSAMPVDAFIAMHERSRAKS